MKKLIVFVLGLVCILSLSSCSYKDDVPTFDDIQDYTEQDEVEQTWGTYTIDVTESSVGEIGRETYNFPVEISEDDANVLSEIINGGTWIEELTQCESDCVINLKGHWAQYNSESGILNKYNVKELSSYSSKAQEVNGMSLVLSDEDRKTVNAILEKYITLGIETN